MAKKKHDGSNAATRLVVVVAGLVLIISLAVWWCWPVPPRMGTDKDVFVTVDALFTALTSRDNDRLTDCEHRLLALKASGKLPQDASEYLEKIIGDARAGHWDSAAKSLYGFIQVQIKFKMHASHYALGANNLLGAWMNIRGGAPPRLVGFEAPVRVS